MSDDRATTGELPSSAEAEWARLARHLELMGDEADSPGWLVFVFAYSPAVADVVRERVKGHFQGGSGRRRVFVELPAETPTRLQNMLPRLLGEETERAGCTWIHAVVGGEGEEEPARWREAWGQLLLGMNERRDAIRRNVRGGLVLAGPLWMKELAQTAAPDLWSVRTLTLELPESVGSSGKIPGKHPGTEESPAMSAEDGVWETDKGRPFEAVRRDFASRLRRVLRLREPDVTIEEKPDADPFDGVYVSRRRSGRTVDVGVVAGLHTFSRPGGITPQVLEVFLRQVQAPLLRESPLLRSTIVYDDGGASVPEGLFEDAARHHVLLLPFSEYESVVDFSRYLEWQSERLDRDPVYPSDLYVEQRAELRAGTSRATTEDILSELHKALRKPVPRFVLVLGDFGTGKTFLLRQLTRRMTADPGSPAPILIEMRDLQKSLSLDMLLAQHFVRQPEGRIPVDAFRYMLSEGKATLLFDGFDELAFRLSYDSVMEHFETLLHAAEGKAKIVITSRTAHFLNERDIDLALGREARKAVGYVLLKLAPFDPSRIHKALVKRLGGEEQAAERERLLARVEDLMGLSSNPRMLAFILDSFTPEELREVGESHAKLTRSGVYERLVTRWLRGEAERAKPRGAEAPLSEAQLWKAVTDFALLLWPVTDKGLRLKDVPEALWQGLQALDPSKGQDTEEIKLSVASRSLLVRDEEGRLSFLHQSILEWLVARDAAKELAESGTAVMLKRRGMSPLMADFFLEMGGSEKVAAWARESLSAGGETSKNAALLLQKLGPAAAEPEDGIHVQIDLSGQDLRGQDFSESDYLKGADLTNARLDGATLVGADLSDSNLSGATLSGADARRAVFRRADLTSADLSLADLRRADLSEAKLREVSFTRACLLGARVSAEAELLARLHLVGATAPRVRSATPMVRVGGFVSIYGVSFSLSGRALFALGHQYLPWVDTYKFAMCWTLPECNYEGRQDADLPGRGEISIGGGWGHGTPMVDAANGFGGAFRVVLDDEQLEIQGIWRSGGAGVFTYSRRGIRHMAVHPTRPLVAAVDDDDLIRLLDVSKLLASASNDPLLATLGATPNGWLAFAPDGRYKIHGDAADLLWHSVDGFPFDVGELDEDLDAFDIPPRRVPLDEPLFEMPE